MWIQVARGHPFAAVELRPAMATFAPSSAKRKATELSNKLLQSYLMPQCPEFLHWWGSFYLWGRSSNSLRIIECKAFRLMAPRRVFTRNKDALAAKFSLKLRNEIACKQYHPYRELATARRDRTNQPTSVNFPICAGGSKFRPIITTSIQLDSIMLCGRLSSKRSWVDLN